MRRALALLAALALAAPGGATPYDPGGPGGTPRFSPTPRTRAQGALVLHHMGDCVVARDAGAARALLRSVPGTRDEERIANGLISRLQQCFAGGGEGLQFRAAGLRGALAEGFYRAHFAADPAFPSDAAAPALPQSWSAAYQKDPGLGAVLALEALAACVTRAAPSEVAGLVRTFPGSAEEAGRFQAITPHLGACIGAGRTFSTDRPTLRALLAESLLRMAEASPSAGAQATAAPGSNPR